MARSTFIQVRVSSDEKDALQRLAKIRGLSVSTLIRNLTPLESIGDLPDDPDAAMAAHRGPARARI